jgi:predicted KAP-like P-loop ATPase
MGWTTQIRRWLGLDTQSQPTIGQDHPTIGPPMAKTAVTGDNPIQQLEDDALGRSSLARSFAQQVLALDASQGVVVGVLGAWGSGKTSFVNLARAELGTSGVAILDFNPWMFSGAAQLVESFFVEVAAQLKIRPGLAGLGKDLEDYGETFSGMAWLPLVGPWIERGRGAAKIIGRILQRRKEGVGGRRAKITAALSLLDKPFVVVLDDIDRLSSDEIRDVFRLVRLTASFPNIIYVVAFDRARVETALSEQGVPGRAYLEKILQVAVDLPAIPDHVLNQQIFSAVDAALAGIENRGRFDNEVWPDVFMEIIRPLIRSMRDVRRYAAAINGTVRALDGQIALADVLALEAVRVFLPDVFGSLHGAVEGLTTPSERSVGGQGDPPQLKAKIEGLLAAAKERADVVRAMIERLFPAAKRHIGGSHFGHDWLGQWRRERRVAHEDFLRLYLERLAGEGLQAFTDAERAWVHMADREALEAQLRSVNPNRLQDVISSLEAYESQFAPEHVVPGTIVLLNMLSVLPERRGGMFELETRLVVSRVTYRLLRSLKSAPAVEAAVRQILPEVKSLSAKLELITDVGYREGAGAKLVSQAAAAEFERALRDEIRAASVDDLSKESDLVRLFLVVRQEADPSEPQLAIPDQPKLTLAVLQAARSEVRRQSSGNRAVRRFPRLAWDVLIELYGGEPALKQRIESLKASAPQGADELLALADKYISGWRPTEFGDD